MPCELPVLLVTAATIGAIHTVLGPDHYLPFIVMSQSGRWSLRKTTCITLFCGMGHVLGSVVLGVIGVGFGIAVTKVETVETLRAGIAAWGLIAFGLVYFAWGVRKALRNKPHRHAHSHGAGVTHEHDHTHHEGHLHAHPVKEGTHLTPWVLFMLFLLGPCEPLIPLLMYPAATGNLWSLVLVTAVFGVVTLATMTSIVLLSVRGIGGVPVSRMARFTHALAGATLLSCGVSVLFLG